MKRIALTTSLAVAIAAGGLASTAAAAPTWYRGSSVVDQSPAAKKFHTVPSAKKFHAVPSAKKFHAVPSAKKFHAVPSAKKFHTVPAAKKFHWMRGSRVSPLAKGLS